MNINVGAFSKIGCGMYVICARKGDKFNGQIANTVFQITSQPPTIAVSINKKNLTNEYIRESRAFTVSILEQDTPLAFIGRWGFRSGREVDKFEGVNFKLGETKAPIVLDHTLAYLEARLINELDVETHTLFVGEVVACDVLKEVEPLSYSYYHEVKRGTTPKTAPSYVDTMKGEQPRMDKYRCTVCGWVYDPALGDPDGKIQPGTPFEKLPDSWVCPVCGASKDQFEKI